ncbi:circularly permuted type 2 ATP-grasp protein [soil metagenome]
MNDSPLFAAYTAKLADKTYDEMFSGEVVRDNYGDVHAAFQKMGDVEVRARAESLASAYLDQGVTFGVAGEERPFPLDIVPRLIEADQWKSVESGVKQRVNALEAFLDDVYGEGKVFGDGVVPREVVLTSEHYHRVVAGLKPANGVRIHVSGIDLIRDGNGDFRVLEDNARVPSGVSYVMTNRRAMSAALPEVFEDHRIRPVSNYSRELFAALRAAAPPAVADPTVVVLTPGVYNSAYFEHTLLARTMGVELVEARDLVCRSGRVLMRTTSGLEPVHVIYRRIDDEFIDPVQFRADSMLGVPGLINAARAGNVTIANAVGNGVADDKLLYTYVPDLIRYYLREEPLLKNVDTWRMGDADARQEVLDRLDELVLKPVDGSGGKGIVIGPAATKAELDELRGKIIADPRAWIAQPVISLSTVPTLVEDGIRPRHVDLRPFAVNNGEDVWVLPGGLTRVALPEGELIVNSSRGGGSKDTWVMASLAEPVAEEETVGKVSSATVVEGALPAKGPVLQDEPQEQQQQQQQQKQTGGPTC